MIQYGYTCNRSNMVKKSKMYGMMFVPCIVTIAMCPCFMVLLYDCVFERGRESVYTCEELDRSIRFNSNGHYVSICGCASIDLRLNPCIHRVVLYAYTISTSLSLQKNFILTLSISQKHLPHVLACPKCIRH